ncbi:hypothetical protein ACFT7S_26530 [Streptomyces sp. NPDC057136]|uniref:glycosyltransferase family protein n=1 Tax=Streptomyces sp. NPDC057136 TaxID=3346029 RepID=UPI00363A479C
MTTAAPLVLHISNEPAPFGPHTGFARGFAGLVEEGLLRYVCVVPAAGDELPALRPELVFVQSPQSYPWTKRQVREWLRTAGDPPVSVWDGDAWGGPTKPLRERNLVWMRCAQEVFSVAVGKQAVMLRRACGRPVRYVPNVAPLHLLGPDAECGPGPARGGVTMVGKRLTYFGVELIPDDRERALLVKELHKVPGSRLSVYGKGWRGPYARGPVPFAEQMAVMRRALITAGWNRYRGYTGYFSDRLPIAMCAGRVHVTSRQPALEWLPGPDRGLHLMGTPRAAAERVRELLRRDPAELLAQGRRMSEWARARLTERQALLHMLSPYIPLPAPPTDPWAGLAALDC